MIENYSEFLNKTQNFETKINYQINKDKTLLNMEYKLKD